MANRILWVVAVAMAAAALVAGCVSVKVPEGPYVVAGDSPTEPPAEDRERVGDMDKAALEEEVLHLAAENDELRQEIGKLKREIEQLKKQKDREIEQLKKEKERLEDRIDDLEDR